MSDPTSDVIPDLRVEQLALGELPPSEAQELRARLEAAGDPRLAEIERTNREILDDYPPAQMARQIQHKLERATQEPSPASGRWMWIPVGAVAAVALLVWWMTPRPPPERIESALDGSPIAQLERPDPIRLKGGARLQIERRRGTQAEALRSGSQVVAGDQLAIAYQAAEPGSGVILSLDGAGEVTLHFPADPQGSTQLQPGRVVALDHSYELDDAPGFERFVFVTAQQPIDVLQVMAAARAVAEGSDPGVQPLVLPADHAQRSLMLRKGADGAENEGAHPAQ